MSEVIEEIKQMRLNLDAIAQMTSQLKPVSDPLKDCVRHLFFAKGWCGHLLAYFGEPTPYSNDGKRKSVADIEPTDAHVDEFEDDADYEGKNHVEKVDYLRQAIKGYKEQVLLWSTSQGFVVHRNALWSIQEVWVRLTDAFMSLGFELQRVREEHERSTERQA